MVKSYQKHKEENNVLTNHINDNYWRSKEKNAFNGGKEYNNIQ